MFVLMAPIFVLSLAFLFPTPALNRGLVEAQEFSEEPLVAEIFGYSEQGRPLLQYRFGTGEECVLVFGGIHGNERGTVALLEQFAHDLARHPETISADKRVVVIPLANPDGYFARTDKLNANLVNLNRNFFTDDWLQQAGDDQTFAGTAPFSERETQALVEAVNACRPSTLIAFHSQGALVSPEDNHASQQLGQWYASQTGYGYFTDWDFAGTATRWFAEATHQAAITVELTFHDQSDWLINQQVLWDLVTQKSVWFEPK